MCANSSSLGRIPSGALPSSRTTAGVRGYAVTDLQATLSPLCTSADPGPSGPVSTKPRAILLKEPLLLMVVVLLLPTRGSLYAWRTVIGYSGSLNSGFASSQSRRASPMVIQSPAAPSLRFCCADDDDEDDDSTAEGRLKGLVHREPGGDVPLLLLVRL